MAKKPKKSPGFWFFTGDWLKDPELRFCSIFARGLLIDLLCILFEAKEQGYASNPDGTPRPNEQVADAVSGGDRSEKLAAIAELERNGVLSRDDRGVLYSRRLARLANLSKVRGEAGSAGGSKPKAKRKPKGKQKRGVSDSVSVSDTEINKHTHTPQAGEDWRKPGWAQDEWDRFRERWNATERAQRTDSLSPPDRWVGMAASPGWLESVYEALEKLPGCVFFERPLAVTKFFEFVDRIRFGEFRETQPQPRSRRGGNGSTGGGL